MASHPHESMEVPDSLVVRVSRERIMSRAADLRFILGELAAGDALLRSRLGGLEVDTRRAIVLGHSRGGVAALEACKADGRFRACANLDGGVLGGPYYEDSTGGRPRAPTLWLQAYHPPPSDAQLATWNMTRAKWDSFDIRADRMLQRAHGGGWRVIIPDTLHQAFSDLGYLRAPKSRSRAARETLLGVRALVAEFAEAGTEGRPPQFEMAAGPGAVRSVQRLPD